MDPNQLFDCNRLRATMRLCFSPTQADALVFHGATDDTSQLKSLESVVRLARLRYTTDRWLAPFKRVIGHQPPLSLRPRPGLSTVSALALSLHLGVGLDIETLSRLFRKSTIDISVMLLCARRKFDLECPMPCPEFASAIGRYRDPGDDRTTRVTLLQHLEGCNRCRKALDQARKTDEQLLVGINQAEKRLGNASDRVMPPRPLWLGPVLVWSGAALIAAVFTIAAVSVSYRLLSHDQAVVPLLSTGHSTAISIGWLIEQTPSGVVDAVNISTGERRMLIQGLPDSGTSVSLSPNDQLIAVVVTAGQPNSGSLRIYQLSGGLLHKWPLSDSTSQDTPIGWLDAGHFLIERAPNPTTGESQTHYRARLSSVAQLVAIDVETGIRHAIFNGQINAVDVSPDGHFAAVDHVTSDGRDQLEIWSIASSRLGGRLVAYEGSYAAPIRWTPNSQEIVFVAKNTSGLSAGETIDLMTLTGNVTSLKTLPSVELFPTNLGPSPTISESVSYSLVGVSQDGQRIAYSEQAQEPVVHTLAYWVIPRTGGAPRKLADSNEFTLLSHPPIWSPSGESLALSVEESYFLPHPQQGSSLSGVNSYGTLAFKMDGESDVRLLEGFSDQLLLAWLPPNALPESRSLRTRAPGLFHTHGIAQNIGVAPKLTGDSRLSSDGTAVLVYDQTYNFAMAVPLNNAVQMAIAGAPNDPSWLPDGSGSIGVVRHEVNGVTISRIELYGQSNVGTVAPVDFDPALLGSSVSATYHEPLLAPNGLRYSYFVVDGRDVALWVGGYDQPPQPIADWSLPHGDEVDPPLISDWIDNNTLIFTETDNWSNGLPQRALLRRVTMSAASDVQVDTLRTWHPNGSEDGIVLQEVCPSADKERIAIRLRHYTGTHVDTDRFDTINLMESIDLSQSIEILRGASGDGMSWSPDGTELTAVIKGALQVASGNGSRIQQVDTGRRAISYPLWVRPDEIWYEAEIGEKGQIDVAIR